ncbi:MAG: VWA domain-containing protein [Candidatus Aminicenantes bacterium]|nr:MAG: VWA domain-containing protein [Candidatus Aminicenantes bacterium]
MSYKIVKISTPILFSLIVFLTFNNNISSSPQTQEKPLEHKVEVVLIEIPVYVVDKDGNSILDLKPEDFILYEDGKRRNISHFALVKNDSPEIASLARRYPAARRQFFLLFDLSFSSPKGILRAREAGLKFIRENILPHDLAAVATSSVFQGIQILTNFINDKSQLESSIESLGLVPTTQISKGPVGFLFSPVIASQVHTVEAERAREKSAALEDQLSSAAKQLQNAQWQDYKGYVQDYVAAFKTLGQALNIIKGRKHLVLFSEGFDIKVLTGKTLKELNEETEAIAFDRVAISRADKDRFGDPSLRLALNQALQHISSSDCLIHTIDVGGLRAPGEIEDTKQRDIYLSGRRGQDTLHLMAADTGGKAYRNVNELDKPLDDLMRLTNSYYLLGYYPEDKKKEGKFRKLKIEVIRPDLQVSHRKGYYEEKSYEKYTDFEKRLHLAELITKDIHRDDIVVDSFVSGFEGSKDIARVGVFLKFPGGQFLDEKKKEVKLEIYGYAIDSSGKFRDFFCNPLNIDVKKARDKLRTHGIKYFDLLLVPPGDYKIRCLIRNSQTGEIGAVTKELSIPNYNDPKLKVSPPIFIDKDPQWLSVPGYDPLKPTGRKVGEGLPIDYPYSIGGEEFLPGIVPTYFEHTQAQFLLRVHNLKLHPVAKIPQTDMKFEVMDDTGVSYKAVQILSIKPFRVKQNLFELLFQFELKSLPPGSYRFKVILTDTLAQQTVQTSSPFIYK